MPSRKHRPHASQPKPESRSGPVKQKRKPVRDLLDPRIYEEALKYAEGDVGRIEVVSSFHAAVRL